MAVGDFYKDVPTSDIPQGDYSESYVWEQPATPPATTEFTTMYYNGWFRIERVRTSAGVFVIRLQAKSTTLKYIFKKLTKDGGPPTTVSISSLAPDAYLSSVLHNNEIYEEGQMFLENEEGKKATIILNNKRFEESDPATFEVTFFGSKADIENQSN